MGRRKIEIKAIKDDRNRSVTFLKRKGGLFKKAHELSVLCSVDVAVFIFGSNKKLYEYSSCDMRELIHRYTYHGGPNEHKGPSDFNGGNDDDEDEDGEGTPPHGDAVESHMIPPQFPGQPPYQHMRNHTPSASPPIPNGVPFQPHHQGHPVQRGHTPQPQHMGSRPSSRNDMRRMGAPGMMQQPVGPPGPPQQPVNGYAFMPNPAIYNPQNPQPMPPNMPPHGLPAPQYPYPPPQPHPHQMQPYVEDQRRPSLPPAYPPPPPQQGPPISVSRPEPSPPLPHPQQLPPQPLPHMSPPQPQPQQMPHPPQEIQPPAPLEPKTEEPQRPQPPLLNTDTAIKKLPQRKQHSIFTPIDENRSILQQHLASFTSEPQPKSESLLGRSQSVDVGSVSRNGGNISSPPMPQRANTQTNMKSRNSVPTIPEATFTPPSRANSFKIGGGAARPRLTVQIPDEASDAGGSATAESNSPRNSTDATSHTTRRATDSHSSNMVLPPPSPSASALLSAGASGPPNPFARPPPQTQPNGNMHIDTPVSALPSRFLGTEFLPSPNSFYNEWNFRGSEGNTLPSPLNFATPVVGSGPSFLRDDNAATGKRKSPETGVGAPGEGADHGSEPKRIKVD